MGAEMRELVSKVHACAFPHGFKGQNESRRELQNGMGQAKVPISEEFDWFLRGVLPVSRGIRPELEEGT